MRKFIPISSLGVIGVFALAQCNVIWRSPKSYEPKTSEELQSSIMTLDAYTNSGLISSHARPYMYEVTGENGQGAVFVFGAEHTNDPKDNQLQLIEEKWNQFQPTVALVEGRLGFLFSWIQDPVKTLGEGGLVAKLAKSNRINLYSWEPDRDYEIDNLLKNFDPYHVAAFYCLRPYRGNYSGMSVKESNKVMARLIEERTDRKGIKGYILSVHQIDSIWQNDHPDLGDWRTYEHPQNGWPEGKFKEIAEQSNMLRDVHMCNSIIDLVNDGERVFISMGSSHAPRIEKTLKENLN